MSETSDVMQRHEAGDPHKPHRFKDEQGKEIYCPGRGHLSADALDLQRWLIAGGDPDYRRWTWYR